MDLSIGAQALIGNNNFEKVDSNEKDSSVFAGSFLSLPAAGC
jgi:hypothetical protein